MTERVFVDTSALFAAVVHSDRAHEQARRTFARLRAAESVLLTTSYVLVETYALLLSRIGIDAVQAVRESVAPLLDVTWVDADLHERGLDLMLERAPRLSLVDAVSFIVVRDARLDAAWAYDSDFKKEGFQVV